MSDDNFETFETYMLPQYVKDYFGGKIVCKKKDDATFHFQGPMFEMYIGAETIAEARRLVKKHVIALGNITDKRVRSKGKVQ